MFKIATIARSKTSTKNMSNSNSRGDDIAVIYVLNGFVYHALGFNCVKSAS